VAPDSTQQPSGMHPCFNAQSEQYHGNARLARQSFALNNAAGAQDRLLWRDKTCPART